MSNVGIPTSVGRDSLPAISSPRDDTGAKSPSRISVATGSPVVDAANGHSPLKAPAVKALPKVERGFLAELYLKVRDFLVDRFPSLDRVLPEGERSSGEKAQVYALKVRDTVRALAKSADTPAENARRRKLDAFVTIARNARESAVNLYSELTHTPPGFLKGSDILKTMQVQAARDRDTANYYSDFAERFAQVVSEYPTPAAFDCALGLFSNDRLEELFMVDWSDPGMPPEFFPNFNADWLVSDLDVSDLPLLIPMAAALDESDDTRPHANRLNNAVRQQSQWIDKQKDVLNLMIIKQRTELRSVLQEIDEINVRLGTLADPGTEPDPATVSALRKRHEDAKVRFNSARENMKGLGQDVGRLNDKNRGLERAAIAINSFVLAHEEAQSIRQDRKLALNEAAKRAGIVDPAPEARTPPTARTPLPLIEAGSSDLGSAVTAHALLGQTDSIQHFPG